MGQLGAANLAEWLGQLGFAHMTHLTPGLGYWLSCGNGRSTREQAKKCESSLGLCTEPVYHQFPLILLAKASHMAKLIISDIDKCIPSMRVRGRK